MQVMAVNGSFTPADVTTKYQKTLEQASWSKSTGQDYVVEALCKAIEAK
ncbi:hypothetical protein BH24ACI4_BH24ACI4_13400 [soil metagenome]